LYRVDLIDLSAYGDNVVIVTDAPVYATIECASFNEAFDVCLEYGDVFQCNVTYPDAS